MNISFKELEPIIREKLDSGGEVVIKPKGTSMLPLIVQGEDEVVLKKNTGKLKKYDIPFYKRKSGQFVLHRIIKVRENDYVLCGDNQHAPEYGVTDDMIIGVVSQIRKKDRIINVDDKDYLKYARSHVRKKQILHLYYILRRKAADIIKKRHE